MRKMLILLSPVVLQFQMRSPSQNGNWEPVFGKESRLDSGKTILVGDRKPKKAEVCRGRECYSKRVNGNDVFVNGHLSCLEEVTCTRPPDGPLGKQRRDKHFKTPNTLPLPASNTRRALNDAFLLVGKCTDKSLRTERTSSSKQRYFYLERF